MKTKLLMTILLAAAATAALAQTSVTGTTSGTSPIPSPSPMPSPTPGRSGGVDTGNPGSPGSGAINSEGTGVKQPGTGR